MTRAEHWASALLRRLTLNEKIAMLHQYAPAVPRLGIAAFHTGQEVLHSASWLSGVTVFPQAVGLAAAWDPALMEAVGAAVGAEVREKYEREPSVTLNVWGPVVNLLRDPRWGRNEEGYSEDPFLTTALAVGYCRGLRGGGGEDEPRVLVTAPTLKHFLAYNHETDKDNISATGMRPRVLWEYELRPFDDAIKAGVVDGVMLSYNAINGRPGHVSPYTALLRDRKPDLVVVADAHGTASMVDELRYFDDPPLAYAAAMHAGLDSFTNNSENPALTVMALRAAVDAGLLTEERIDASVRRLLLIRARLGEFDRSTTRGQDAPAGAPLAESAAHRRLALDAARRSVVLLKNERGVLPLDPNAAGTIALIGPHADLNLLDWVCGTPTYRITVREAFLARLGAARLDFVEGVDRIALRNEAGGGYLATDVTTDGAPLRVSADGAVAEAHFDVFDWGGQTVALRSAANGRFVGRLDDGELASRAEIPGGWFVPEALRPIVTEDGSWLLWHIYTGTYVSIMDGQVRAVSAHPDEAARFRPETLVSAADMAARAARAARAAVVVVGAHPMINGREGEDQAETGLPAGQDAVARAVTLANPNTVVVVVSGNPHAVSWLDAHAPALLWSSHGGQDQGRALADVLFGDHAPAGRLPQTWYHSADDLGDILDYDIIKREKTYLYFRGTPLYPFGHGLTYARFHYGRPEVSADRVAADGEVRVTVSIDNVSATDSDEVAQLYVRAPGAVTTRPVRQLCGFSRVHIPAGQSRVVTFRVQLADLAYWDVGQQRLVVEPGRYELLVGRSVSDIVGRAVVTVDGDRPPPRRLDGPLVRASHFDDYQHMRIVDEARGAGEAVSTVEAGAWLCYRNVDLGPRVDCVVVQASAAHSQSAVEVRVDDPVSGALLGTVGVPVEADGWQWSTVEADAHGGGVHDVYLVFSQPDIAVAAFGVTRRPDRLR